MEEPEPKGAPPKVVPRLVLCATRQPRQIVVAVAGVHRVGPRQAGAATQGIVAKPKTAAAYHCRGRQRL